MLTVFCCMLLFPTGPLAGDGVGDEKTPAAKPTLTLTIHCDQRELKAGDEIPITLVVTNKGDSAYTYRDRNYDRSGRMDEYELSAVDASGQSVPDPRAKRPGGIGGGLSTEGRLAPGQCFEKTIALNRWALVKEPGDYQVTGTFRLEGQWPAIVSPPIRVTLQPRTDREMAAYVKKKCRELSASSDDQTRSALVRKLMYTCDRRIVPTLLETLYKADAARFWVGEAFCYYLPHDQETNEALLRAATTRGLAEGMLWILKQRGFLREKIKPLIDVSLRIDRPQAWSEGARAAQQYPDDRFTPRLIAIATDLESGARREAIYALAFHRTDDSVAVLRQLLEEPDPAQPRGRTIRQTTEHAIRAAYLYRGNSEGRRLRKDDFPSKYQKRN